MKKTRLLFVVVCLAVQFTQAQVAAVGETLPRWQPGFLDIHHINTGRGNAAYVIFPDATTMLIDAGELSPLDARTFTPRNAVIRPDSSRKPFQWIVHYINSVAPSKTSSLDYAVITHFHDDHFGAWYPAAPRSAEGQYLLTGITGVGDMLPIRTLIDRGFPGYNYPYSMKRDAAKYAGGEISFNNTMDNYFSFLNVQQQKGMKVQMLKAGSRGQITMLHDANKYPSFYVQNVKSGQWIWTGSDSSIVSHFNNGDMPDENCLSLALTLHYGNFIYYTGGDNPGNAFTGDDPLRDVESAIAKATGEVDIAITDHHGNRDAVNETMVKTLRPRIWIGQTWSADHPGHEVLLRMVNQKIYEGPRDLFCTNMLEANRLVIGSLINRVYKSTQGHIVVRVLPGGSSYYIIILDDTISDMPVKAVFGPYQSKLKKN